MMVPSDSAPSHSYNITLDLPEDLRLPQTWHVCSVHTMSENHRLALAALGCKGGGGWAEVEECVLKPKQSGKQLDKQLGELADRTCGLAGSIKM